MEKNMTLRSPPKAAKDVDLILMLLHGAQDKKFDVLNFMTFGMANQQLYHPIFSYIPLKICV